MPTREMAPGSSDTVADFDGTPITDAEIRSTPKVKMELYKAAIKVYQAKQQEHQVLKKALEEYLETQLLEKEAKSQNISVEDLLKKEVEAKLKEPTDKEVRAFYEERKINRPYDKIKDRIKEYMNGQRRKERQEVYVSELKTKYKVSSFITDFAEAKPLPPKFDVSIAKDNPVKGKDDAKITIVEFSDYECPFCLRAEKTVLEVLDKYKDEVKLVFRHYPLPFHKNAKGAHIAAQCAKDQGKFWEYHDLLFKNQKALDEASLLKYAEQLNLKKSDQEALSKCIKDKKYAAVVEADIAAGKEYGVTGTPAFFVNGRLISGARPLADFVELIELEKKGPTT